MGDTLIRLAQSSVWDTLIRDDIPKTKTRLNSSHSTLARVILVNTKPNKKAPQPTC